MKQQTDKKKVPISRMESVREVENVVEVKEEMCRPLTMEEREVDDK